MQKKEKIRKNCFLQDTSIKRSSTPPDSAIKLTFTGSSQNNMAKRQATTEGLSHRRTISVTNRFVFLNIEEEPCEQQDRDSQAG